MPWFKVDDGLYSHPKWLAASLPARGLWATAGAWCAAQITDGAVPRHVLPMLGAPAEVAEELVEVGLWEHGADGWQFHDWFDFQPSAERVRADRASARDRQRRARDKAASRRDNSVSHASVTAGVTVPPTRPDPAREGQGRGRPDNPPPLTTANPDCTRCAGSGIYRDGGAEYLCDHAHTVPEAS